MHIALLRTHCKQMTKSKTIIITGANGFIGNSLSEFYSEAGWTVRKLQRTLPENRNTKFSYFKYSLDEPLDETAFLNADALIHCAVQHYSSKNKNSDQINKVGTKAIFEMCRKHSIQMIFLSTLSAHPRAESHYGKNKLELESIFDLQKDTVLRLGLVLGAGGLFGNLSGFISKSKFIPLLAGEKKIQTLAIQDLCLTTKKIIEGSISGKFNLADPEAHTLRNMYELISNSIGVKSVFVPLPLWFAQLISSIGEGLGLTLPISSESVLGLKHLEVFETKKDLVLLGITLKGMKQSIEELHANTNP